WLTTYAANTTWPQTGATSTATPCQINPGGASVGTSSSTCSTSGAGVFNGNYCPNAGGATTGGDPDPYNLCSSTSGHRSHLSQMVIQTDGSIGYVDMATAITKAYTETNGSVNNKFYWVPLQNNVGTGNATTGYLEPSTDPKIHIAGSGATPGAACDNPTLA